MIRIFINILLPFLLLSCKEGGNNIETVPDTSSDATDVYVDYPPIIDSSGNTIFTRFNPPPLFERSKTQQGTFAHYLQYLPLKQIGSPVLKYTGEVMPYVSEDVSEAVIAMDIGKKDLQQCADAVIRLRAEHLYQQKAYDQISFTLTNGFKMDYSEWMQGKRLKVKGNKTWWEKKSPPSNTYKDLRNYLETVFMYAGTISMVKETEQVPLDGMKIGDVFVISDAHAVIVVDMCKNPSTGEELFLLAQSYMPARDIHVLQNLNDRSISPWFSINFGKWLVTPQWQFEAKDLRRYK